MQIQSLLDQTLVNSKINTEGIIKKRDDLKAEADKYESYLSVDIDEKALSKTIKKIKTIEIEIAEKEVLLSKRIEDRKNLNGNLMMVSSAFNKKVSAYLKKVELNDDGERIIKYANIATAVIQRYRVVLQSEKVSEVADTMTQCYKQLANKKTLIDRVEMDPETLDLMYMNKEDEEVPRKSLSAGEKQLMVIALLWALAICSKRKLPVIIDTPLSRLDSAHRQALVKIYLLHLLNINQYAFWRLTDLLTPLFRNLYRPNPLYTYDEYVKECASIMRTVIDENPRNFLGVLRLRLRSAGENLCNFYNNPMNIPRSVWRNVNQVSEFCDDYQVEYGQYPSIEEIMEATGFSEKCVKDYLRYAAYSPISLNTEVVKEGVDGYDSTFTGTVGDNIEDPTWNPEKVYDREHQSELIMEAIMSLTEVEREIILNKCGFDGYDLNRDAVRAKYDLSSRRYAKLLAGALAKLHEALEVTIEF